MRWKPYRSVILLFMVSTLLVLPAPSIAKTEVVYASYKYVMGDNDTKNDAKRLCFLEAKRRCLEKVGSYVESLTEVQKYELTKDEIRSYASAIIKVEVVSEEIAFEGESVVINTTVKAEVDANHTRKELQRISEDKALQARIKEQQAQIESLARKITRLQSELGTASYESSLKLRKERKTSFESIDIANERIKNIILAKRGREEERKQRRKEFISRHARTVRRVLQYVEIGMIPKEVGQIIKEILGDAHPFSFVVNGEKELLGKGKQGHWDKLNFLFMNDDITGQSVLVHISYEYTGTYVALKSATCDVLKNEMNKKTALTGCWELRRYLWGEDDQILP